MNLESVFSAEEERFREAAKKLAMNADELTSLAHTYRQIECDFRPSLSKPSLPSGFIVRVWGPWHVGMGSVRIDSYIENISGNNNNLLSTFFKRSNLIELSIDPSTHLSQGRQLEEAEAWHMKRQIHKSSTRTFYSFDDEGNYSKTSGGSPKRMEPGDFEMAGSILHGMKSKLTTVFEENTKQDSST